MSNAPGSQATKMAKAQNAATTEFKRPLPYSSIGRKTKPKILTEERYIEEMSKIIQRDFFPHLERLRAQNDYLDAEARRDYKQMAVIRTHYNLANSTWQELVNKAMSPATFETPDREGNGSATPRPEIMLKSQPSVGKGETQDTFDGCLDKFMQHYTSEDNYSFQEIVEEAKATLKLKYAVSYKHEELSAEKLKHLLELPSIEQQFGASDSSRKITTWSYTNLNSVMYMPDGIEQKAECKQSIQHKATRLTEANANLPNTNAMVKEKAEAPNTFGYDLLRSPSPSPGKDFSPIMTWGEIDGKPFRLDGGDTPLPSNPGPSFHINENSHRENIALGLADKVSEKIRMQKQHRAKRSCGTTIVRSNKDRLASMSPAARRLASSKLGLGTPIPTLSTGHKNNKPLTTAKANTSTSSTPLEMGSSLTDNLLKIPTKRRHNAVDF